MWFFIILILKGIMGFLSQRVHFLAKKKSFDRAGTESGLGGPARAFGGRGGGPSARVGSCRGLVMGVVGWSSQGVWS